MDSPSRYATLLGLTRRHVELGRFEAAADACREAIACAPERAGPYGVLALALVSAGRLEDAAAAAAGALERAPGDPLLLNLSASIALRQGLPEIATRRSRAVLARDPHDQRALADLAFVAAASGAPGAERDPTQLLRVSRPSAPDGFTSIAEFNRRLAAAIVSCTSLDAPAADAPLVGGRRLKDFHALDPAWTKPLLATFRTAVGHFAATLDVDALHPVRTGQPAEFEVVGWANVMTAGDFERPHIHEGGWLSGVYYVETPPVTAATEDPPPGSLLLGGHHCEGALRSALVPYRPRAGELVVFPSYLCHRTVPFAGEGRRISIAFDILRGPGMQRGPGVQRVDTRGAG